MSDGYGAASKSKQVVLRCLNTVGSREHFGHFFFDFALPLYNWLYARGRLYEEDLTIYFKDQSIEKFRSVIDEMFYCRVVTKYIPSQVRGCFRDMTLGMEGHNRKVLNLTLDDYIGNPVQFQADLRSYIIKRLNIQNVEPDTLVLVQRKMEGDDRGGKRRNISNHDELRGALESLADKENMEFQNAVLEDMSFKEQVALFLRASIVVGQHGAGLCHILWLKPGGILMEFNSKSGQEYRFGEFCKFFRHVRQTHMVCELDETVTGLTQGAILIPLYQVLLEVEQEIKRRMK